MSSLLLLIAFIAITLSAIFGWAKVADDHRGGDLTKWIVFTSPFYVPAIFAAYALGRKSLTVSLIISFALAEVGAICIAYWVETTLRWI